MAWFAIDQLVVLGHGRSLARKAAAFLACSFSRCSSRTSVLSFVISADSTIFIASFSMACSFLNLATQLPTSLRHKIVRGGHRGDRTVLLDEGSPFLVMLDLDKPDYSGKMGFFPHLLYPNDEKSRYGLNDLPFGDNLSYPNRDGCPDHQIPWPPAAPGRTPIPPLRGSPSWLPIIFRRLPLSPDARSRTHQRSSAYLLVPGSQGAGGLPLRRAAPVIPPSCWPFSPLTMRDGQGADQCCPGACPNSGMAKILTFGSQVRHK